MKAIVIIIGILFAGTSGIQAQDCNPTPPNGYPEAAAFSLFNEGYRGKDWNFALTYGRWLVCAKPTELQGIPKGRFSLSSQYNRLITVYTEIGLTKEDPAEREAYIDTALSLFDESFEMFAETDEEKYELHQRRGRYYLENYENIEDGLQKAYADFEAMFEIDPEKTTTLADGYYIKAAIQNMVRNDRKEEVIAMIETASEYAGPDLEAYFDETLGDVFDSPEERLEFCGAKVEENPEDIESLRCVAEAQEDLNMQTELLATTRKIHELDPTFESALSLADIEKGNAEYQEAATYYKEALSKAETDEQKKEINIDLSDVYASMGQLQTAKKHIRDAIKVDPNYGLAYIKLASVYGQAITECAGDNKLEAQDRVVYWVVIDYLNKAKQVDASVANTVNSQLSSYTPVVPSTEDKFFTLGYEQGQKVKVDGSLKSCYSWINETTTVR